MVGHNLRSAPSVSGSCQLTFFLSLIHVIDVKYVTDQIKGTALNSDWKAIDSAEELFEELESYRVGNLN